MGKEILEVASQIRKNNFERNDLMDFGKFASSVAKAIGKGIAGSISSQAEHYSNDSRYDDETREKFSNVSNVWGNISRGDFSHMNSDDEDDY